MKFNKKQWQKQFNSWELGDWCKVWARLGITDPKAIITKLIIYGMIGGLLAGYFYWKGLKQVAPTIDVGYQDELLIKAPPNFAYLDKLALYKPENSLKWQWLNSETKKKYADVTVGDIPTSAQLRPYGFCSNWIIGTGIASGTNYIGGEAFGGYRWARLWNWRTEVFASDKGVYVGCSYKIRGFMLKNTYTGIACGKGYKGDNRGMLYLSVKL